MSSNTALPDQDTINQFIIRCHFDLAAVQAAVAEYPALVGTVSSIPGAEGETPLGAAAHVGNRAIAEYLLDHGAELEFCAAVMLGMDDYVRAIVDADPGMANASGAHTIPALNHATVAGQAGLARYLVERGAAVTGGALHGAVHAGDAEMVAWLLERGADASALDYRGNTPVQNALEAGRDDIAALLRAAG